jgi:hypothetical protein
MGKNECFIVMPFGIKQFPDGSGRTYDFDKVYRVLIQRAVREVGMIPVRADERMGSALIHTEMFRDLRDRTVVLADLSLDNPNVFYELGIRHVMSSSGTVLICRRGSTLPFDVKLSKVLFYDFDGVNLDWEEVEQVLKLLKIALQEAAKGLPDSPVHALLSGSVVRIDTFKAQESYDHHEEGADAEPLRDYQQLIAEYWKAEGVSIEDLYEKHSGSIFGSRCLAYLCLKLNPLPGIASRLAKQLYNGQQYRLTNELYNRLYNEGILTSFTLLYYASSYSEANPNLAGADRAIILAKEALEKVEQQFPNGSSNNEIAVDAYSQCYRYLAGLQQWRWQLSHEADDLDLAIKACEDWIRNDDRARKHGTLRHPGFLAQARIKQLVLLRIRDQSLDRPDSEGHRDAILALRPQADDNPVGLSYLGWYQAITLADMGATEESQRKALTTLANDAKIKTEPQYFEIGRRQYLTLRRFLEQYAPYLRNPSLIGRISQILQIVDNN